MSKRFRNIIVLSIILLLLIGANFAIYIAKDSSGVSIEENEIIYISNYSLGSVTKIRIDNELGEIVLIAEDGTWYVQDDRDIVLDQGVVSDVAYMLAHIVGERIVSDGVDTANLYGMVTPAAIITTYHDGVLEQSFVIGNRAPVANEYYMQSSVFKRVYTVDSSYYAFAQVTVEDLITLNSISIEHADMKKIDITNTLGEQYTLQRTADDNNISLCYWEFIQPFSHDADTAVLYGTETYEGMISFITQLAGDSILGYIDADSEKYSQDNPIFTAAIYDYDNEYQSFAIGDYGDESNYSIVFSGDNTIYSIAKTGVPFIGYSAYFVAESNLNLINIDSVESVSIDLPDIKAEMAIERYTAKNADGTDYTDANGNLVYQAEITIAGLDESTIAAPNIYEQKILFYHYITTIKIDDLIIEGLDVGEYAGSIVFDLQSIYKDTYTIEFYEYSLTHYMAKKNGEDALYLVSINSIENIAQRYKLLLAGELE